MTRKVNENAQIAATEQYAPKSEIENEITACCKVEEGIETIVEATTELDGVLVRHRNWKHEQKPKKSSS